MQTKRVSLVRSQVNPIANDPDQPHNERLQVLAQTGAVGLAAAVHFAYHGVQGMVVYMAGRSVDLDRLKSPGNERYLLAAADVIGSIAALRCAGARRAVAAPSAPVDSMTPVAPFRQVPAPCLPPGTPHGSELSATTWRRRGGGPRGAGRAARRRRRPAGGAARGAGGRDGGGSRRRRGRVATVPDGRRQGPRGGERPTAADEVTTGPALVRRSLRDPPGADPLLRRRRGSAGGIELGPRTFRRGALGELLHLDPGPTAACDLTFLSPILLPNQLMTLQYNLSAAP